MLRKYSYIPVHKTVMCPSETIWIIHVLYYIKKNEPAHVGPKHLQILYEKN